MLQRANCDEMGCEASLLCWVVGCVVSAFPLEERLVRKRVSNETDRRRDTSKAGDSGIGVCVSNGCDDEDETKGR